MQYLRSVTMQRYLTSSATIDWKNPNVMKKAEELSQGLNNPVDIAKACFLYVRDGIRHSNDYQLNPVTCKASDVLQYKHGFCYAKSHLLAALLRANTIPAGLCYQRLTVDNDEPPFCLHGLNAVYLPDMGWYRIDARGNKNGVEADFTPPREQLAFPIVVQGETDFPEIWPEPLPEVLNVLESANSYQEVAANLPDVEIIMNGYLPQRGSTH